MGKIPDDLVLEAASRFADAQAGAQPGDGWQRLTEKQQRQLASAIRVLLVWLDARPKPH